MSEQVTRREFLKGAAITGAAAAAGSLLPQTAAMAAGDVPDKWDKEADLVIVGAGSAGMAAAIEARDGGASVIVLEKASKYGGTTALSGGIIQGSGTDLEKANNIADSPDIHYKYWMAAGEGLVDPEIVRALADNSGPNIKWMESQGCKYINLSGVGPIPYIDPALMLKRIHALQPDPDGTSGGALHARVLYNSAVKKGATFVFDSPVTSLIRDAKNGVVGVRAQSGGKEITVRAKKAVILASGSFDYNKEMARAFSPQQAWAQEVGMLRGVPTITGDGIKMAMALGADLTGMGGTIDIPSVPKAVPFTGGIGSSATLPAIWVNKYGMRFENENNHYAYSTRAVFSQEEHIAWAVFDENTRKIGAKSLGWSDDFSKEIADGRVKTGATLAALADAIKVNSEQLQATVARWNKDVASGADTIFRKTVALKPIDTPAFYATRVVPSNLGAQGGVKINVKMQVIDVAGKVIPRLYAAGIVAGGHLGPYYPGSGTSLAFTLFSGRTAAKTGLAEQPWSPNV